MKIQDLPISTVLEERENIKSYLIMSVIQNKEDSEEIDNINKVLIPISSFAAKDEVNALVEQNSQLVKLINQIICKYQECELVIQDLKKQIEQKSETNLPNDIIRIYDSIEELNNRLDNSVVEF